METTLDFYKKYSEYAYSTSFVDILKSFVQNDEYKDTTSQTIWRVLHEAGDALNSVVTDKVVNYIQNVSDVNTCYIPALVSQGQMVKYKLDDLNKLYSYLPPKLQTLLNIFSINKEYLVGNADDHILSTTAIRDMFGWYHDKLIASGIKINENESKIFETIDKYLDMNHVIPDEVYKDFMRYIFKAELISTLNISYDDTIPTDKVIDNILYKELDTYDRISDLHSINTVIDKTITGGSNYPLDGETLDTQNIIVSGIKEQTNSFVNQIETYKQLKGIPKSFDPFKLADEIALHGLKQNHNLSKDELELVENVLNYHAQAKFNYKRNTYEKDRIITNYAYYREKELIDEIKTILILFQLIKYQSNMILKSYSLDDSYFEFSDRTDSEFVDPPKVLDIFYRYWDDELNRYGFKPITSKDEPVDKLDQEKISNYGVIIDAVADGLVEYCFFIQNIRENIKTICQKHAMRGTGVLLTHVINDYLLKELPILVTMIDDFDYLPKFAGEERYDIFYNKLYEQKVSENIAQIKEYETYKENEELYNIIKNHAMLAAIKSKEKVLKLSRFSGKNKLEDLPDWEFDDSDNKDLTNVDWKERIKKYISLVPSSKNSSNVVITFNELPEIFTECKTLEDLWNLIDTPQERSEKISADIEKYVRTYIISPDLWRVQLQNDLIPEQVINIENYRNYGNVEVIQYCDTTEYYNVRPEIYTDESIRENRDYSLNKQFWKMLDGISDPDEYEIGVFTVNDIKDFYRNFLNIKSLEYSTDSDHDIQKFLTSLWESGASAIEYDESKDRDSIYYPIDNINNKTEIFNLTADERKNLQSNDQVREIQKDYFLRYSANKNLPYSLIGDAVNRNYYSWKNQRFASQMLHPFMYTMKLWNKLDNIIINGFNNFINDDLIANITKKNIFDNLFGEFGETLNFWKHNYYDFSGYSVRYEIEKHNQYRCDGTTSPLSGYDGLFYPEAADEFIIAYKQSEELDKSAEANSRAKILINYESDGFALNVPWNKTLKFLVDDIKESEFFDLVDDKNLSIHNKRRFNKLISPFMKIITSIFYQIEYDDSDIDELDRKLTFYGKWFSHLGYSVERYQFIARQLWYWRDRIAEMITHNYEVTNHHLDIQNNSFILVNTFKEADETEYNPDGILYNMVQNIRKSEVIINDKIGKDENEELEDYTLNRKAGLCSMTEHIPSELWIRWNANPIALPAFDLYVCDGKFENQYERRKLCKGEIFDDMKEYDFGQIKFQNNQLAEANDSFAPIIRKFVEFYTGDIEAFNYDDTMLNATLHSEEFDKNTGNDDDQYFTPGIETIKKINLRNRLPIFFDLEASANVIIFACWNKDLDENCNYLHSSFIEGHHLDHSINPPKTLYYDRSYKAAHHIACRTLVSINLDNNDEVYTLVNYADDLKEFDTYLFENGERFFFAHYLYDYIDGNIFVCSYSILSLGDAAYNLNKLDQLDPLQKITLRIDRLKAQVLVDAAYRKDRLYDTYTLPIDINNDELFKQTMLISPKTEVRFSLYQNSTNIEQKPFISIAFCGSRITDLDDRSKWSDNYIVDNFLRAKTRYKFDSETSEYISLNVSNKYWGSNSPLVPAKALMYNTDIKGSHNSYDKNDKFICVIQTIGEFNLLANQNNPYPMLTAKSYNIMGDAGYIPHVAYSSPKLFGINEADEIREPNLSEISERKYSAIYGVSRTWKSPFYYDMETISFDILGLENKNVDASYKNSLSMIVTDNTDNVKTLVNPVQFVDAIYRIYEQSSLVNDSDNLDFKRIFNPQLSESITLEQYGIKGRFLEWTFDFGLRDLENDLERTTLTIVRSSPVLNGEILNQKNWILQSTSLTDIYSSILMSGNNFVKLGLNKYYRKFPLDENNQPVEARGYFIFAGTQNPFKYDAEYDDLVIDKTAVEKIQYDNGIPGIDEAYLSLKIVKNEVADDQNFNSYTLKISIYFKLHEATGEDDYLDKYQSVMNVIPEKSVLCLLSRNKVISLMDYHMLVHHDDLFYNIPEPDKDDLVEWIDSNNQKHQIYQESLDVGFEKDAYDADGTKKYVNHPVKTILDYFYVKEGSVAFKITEESGRDWSFDEDIPGDELTESLANFRKNQEFYGCLRPYSTYVHESINPSLILTCDKLNPFFMKVANIYGMKGLEPSTPKRISNPPENEIYSDEWKYNDDSTDFEKWNKFHFDYDAVNFERDASVFDVAELISTGSHLEGDLGETGSGSIRQQLEASNSSLGKFITELHQLDFSPHLLEPNTYDNTDSNVKFAQYLDLEWEEIKDSLKIYTVYKKVIEDEAWAEDYRIKHKGEEPVFSERGYHFDLYFNLQNLFRSPFEYISSVTKQANTLILEDSYLYLPGDYNSRVGSTNGIENYGILTIYGQGKYIIDDTCVDTKTIPIARYKIYNISDDKPKFAATCIYSIIDHETTIQQSKIWVTIKFDNVGVDISKYIKFNENVGMTNTITTEDIVFDLGVHIHYNNLKDDPAYDLKALSFKIIHDIIDASNPLKIDLDETCSMANKGLDHKNVSITSEKNDAEGFVTNEYQVDIDYSNVHNAEDLNLKIRIPSAFDFASAIDKLGYIGEITAVNPNAVNKLGTQFEWNIIPGKIYPIVGDEIYLGKEHGKFLRKYGYLLEKVSDKVKRLLVHKSEIEKANSENK